MAPSDESNVTSLPRPELHVRQSTRSEPRPATAMMQLALLTQHEPRAAARQVIDALLTREDAERFIEEVRRDDPALASYLRIEERELEAGGLN